MDVHWRQYVGVRQIDGASPQPPQRFTPEEFVAWANLMNNSSGRPLIGAGRGFQRDTEGGAFPDRPRVGGRMDHSRAFWPRRAEIREFDGGHLAADLGLLEAVGEDDGPALGALDSRMDAYNETGPELGELIDTEGRATKEIQQH